MPGNRNDTDEAQVQEGKNIEKRAGRQSGDVQSWMDGRAVYRRPESRPSTMAQRDIVHSEEEMGKLALAFIENMRDHVGRTDADVEEEIAELDASEATFYGSAADQ